MSGSKSYIVVFVVLALVGCGPEPAGSNDGDKAKVEPVEKQSLTSDQKISEGIADFIDQILGTDKRIHKYEAGDETTPAHIEIFSEEDMISVTAYSHSGYPKTIEPYSYEHFNLFVIEYKDVEAARKSFETLLHELTMTTEELEKLNEEDKMRIRSINMRSKPGGLITFNGRFVFSLVETCRDTPLGGTWEQYEDVFLSSIFQKGQTVDMLNANCGGMQYIEQRQVF